MAANAEKALGTKMSPPLHFIMIKYKIEALFIKHRAKLTTDLASLKSVKLYQIWAIKRDHKLLFIFFLVADTEIQ